MELPWEPNSEIIGDEGQIINDEGQVIVWGWSRTGRGCSGEEPRQSRDAVKVAGGRSLGERGCRGVEPRKSGGRGRRRRGRGRRREGIAAAKASST